MVSPFAILTIMRIYKCNETVRCQVGIYTISMKFPILTIVLTII